MDQFLEEGAPGKEDQRWGSVNLLLVLGNDIFIPPFLIFLPL